MKKPAPRIKRERLWGVFSDHGYLAGCQGSAGLAVYSSRQRAEADCCDELGDFVREVRVLPVVRAPKRKGAK